MLKTMFGYLLPCTINILSVIYVLSKLLNKKIDYKSPKVYVSIFIIIIISILNFMYMQQITRILIITIVFCIFNKIIFKEKMITTLLSTITEQCIMFIAEMIFALIIIFIFHADGNQITSTFYGNLLSNIEISLIAMIVVNLKYVQRFYFKLLSVTDKLDIRYLIAIITVLIISVNVILAFIYYEINIGYVLLANLIFFILYGILAYKILKEKNESVKIQTENEVLVNNLKEYEKVLEVQSKVNHENNNQISVIQGMLMNGEDALPYINTIVTDRRQQDKSLFMKTQLVPSGGLQGIIYRKMITMREKDIKTNLYVSKKVEGLNLSNMDTKLNYDICRILGVLLDNAIEETELTKNKAIDISLYEEEQQLIIEVCNVCKEIPNLEEMYQSGYTTKSQGHGYGLSLVQEIVDHNPAIINERAIIKNIFMQIIKIKM